MIALYLHYDMEDALLYVDISVNVFSRQHEHESRTHWFNEVARIEIIKFTSIEEAKEAEKLLIKNRVPVYNTVHNESVYSKHLIRLYTGDWKRLKKFYRKPNAAIRALVSKHIQDAQKGSE